MLGRILSFDSLFNLFDVVGDFSQDNFGLSQLKISERLIIPNVFVLFPLEDAAPKVVLYQKVLLKAVEEVEVMLW